MSQTELVFRGIDANECDTFIREVHKRALEAGRFRDNAWMADVAMAALGGDALKLFEELNAETQGDWALLRNELLRRYSFPASKIVPAAPEAIQQDLKPVPTDAPDPLIRIVPSLSNRLQMRIKVVAPKADYVGYISGFERTELRLPGFEPTDLGRSCILTRDPSKAIAVVPPATAKFHLNVVDPISDHPHSKRYIAPFRTSITGSSNWRASTEFLLGLWLPIGTVTVSGNESDRFSPKEKDKVATDNANARWVSRPYTWSVDSSNRLTPAEEKEFVHTQDNNPWKAQMTSFPDGMKTGLSKTPNGDLTVLFWKANTWESTEDPYLADLYLERFSS